MHLRFESALQHLNLLVFDTTDWNCVWMRKRFCWQASPPQVLHEVVNVEEDPPCMDGSVDRGALPGNL